MQFLTSLVRRLRAAFTPRPAQREIEVERRDGFRHRDGVIVQLVVPGKVSTATVRVRQRKGAPYLVEGAVFNATLLDVSAKGVRLHCASLQPIPGERVYVRVTFASGPVDLGVKTVWSRESGDGFAIGAAYASVIPGTSFLLENYMHGRMQLAA
ncbi:MAG: PilZ domain-containing protein [Proteobacteria bacterium]|nr:PilZ domain-containing protein [Pseudomonadota bacterium]